MGSEQSQMEREADEARAIVAEEQEKFDLNAIPERDESPLAEEPPQIEHTLPLPNELPPPSARTRSSKGRVRPNYEPSKKKKKRKKKQDQVQKQLPVQGVVDPQVAAEELRRLREREPETFGEYAVSEISLMEDYVHDQQAHMVVVEDRQPYALDTSEDQRSREMVLGEFEDVNIAEQELMKDDAKEDTLNTKTRCFKLRSHSPQSERPDDDTVTQDEPTRSLFDAANELDTIAPAQLESKDTEFQHEGVADSVSLQVDFNEISEGIQQDIENGADHDVEDANSTNRSPQTTEGPEDIQKSSHEQRYKAFMPITSQFGMLSTKQVSVPVSPQQHPVACLAFDCVLIPVRPMDAYDSSGPSRQGSTRAQPSNQPFLESDHSDAHQVSRARIVQEERHLPTTINGKYPCSYRRLGCPRLFETHLDKKMHIKDDHIETWRCPTCSHGFHNAEFLENHMKLHNLNSFACPLCDRPFRQPKHLTSHMRTQHHEEDYIARKRSGLRIADADQEFKPDQRLALEDPEVSGIMESDRVRLRTVDLEKALKCDKSTRRWPCPEAQMRFCLETFATKAAAMQHGLEHDSAKPFGCPVCKSGHKSSLFLRKHEEQYHSKESILHAKKLFERRNQDSDAESWLSLSEEQAPCLYAQLSNCQEVLTSVASTEHHASLHEAGICPVCRVAFPDEHHLFLHKVGFHTTWELTRARAELLTSMESTEEGASNPRDKDGIEAYSVAKSSDSESRKSLPDRYAGDTRDARPTQKRRRGLPRRARRPDDSAERLVEDATSSSATQAKCRGRLPRIQSPGKPPKEQSPDPPHQETTDGAMKTFPCPLAAEYDCNKSFKNKKTAVRHGKTHTVEYPCCICHTVFRRYDTLIAHFDKYHPGNENQKYKLEPKMRSTARTSEQTKSASLARTHAKDSAPPTEELKGDFQNRGIVKNDSVSLNDAEGEEDLVRSEATAHESPAFVDDPRQPSHDSPAEAEGWKRKRTVSQTSEETCNREKPLKRPRIQAGLQQNFTLDIPASKVIDRTRERVIPQGTTLGDDLHDTGFASASAEDGNSGRKLSKHRATISKAIVSKESGDESEEGSEYQSGAESVFAPVKSTQKSKSARPPLTRDSYPTELDVDEGSDVPLESSIEFYPLFCRVCHKTFKTERARKAHDKNKKAHRNLDMCETCGRQYYSHSTLRKHQIDSRHRPKYQQPEVTGRFTEHEDGEIKQWRKRICKGYDLSETDFNEMMTATAKHELSAWTYKFATKAEIMESYYTVLPSRNRRSMRRYRDLNFKNVDKSLNWSAEDDADIVRLHRELGPKWVEIAAQITRPPEAVRRRYENQLKYSVELLKGEWSAEESIKFGDAVKEVERLSGRSAGINFHWASVGQKIGTRTAVQCANHWRSLHGVEIHNIWRPSQEQRNTPHSPSQTELRLAEKPVSRGKPSELSVGSIDDSDEVLAHSAEAAAVAEISDLEVEERRESDIEDEDLSFRFSPVRERVRPVPATYDKVLGTERDESEDRDQSKGLYEAELMREQGAEDLPESNPDFDKLESNHSLTLLPVDNNLTGSDGEPALSSKLNQASSGSKDSTQDEEKLPWNPFLAQTPDNRMSMTQVFDQTQANTSALRQTAKTPRDAPTQERPSPGISIQHRPMLSSPQMFQDHDLVSIADYAEDVEMADGSGGCMSAESTSSESEESGTDKDTSTSESEDDHVKDLGDAKLHKHAEDELTDSEDDTSSSEEGTVKKAQKIQVKRSPSIANKQANPSIFSDTSSEDSESVAHVTQTPLLPQASGARGTERQVRRRLLPSKNAESDSESDEEPSSDSDIESEPVPSHKPRRRRSHKPSWAHTPKANATSYLQANSQPSASTNSFLANIEATARKNQERLLRQRYVRRWESDDDSDDDETLV